MERQAWNILYKKAKYQANPEVNLLYNKCKYPENSDAAIKLQIQGYQENSEKETNYQKNMYQGNPEIQGKCRKSRYQENPGIQREYQKGRYQENTEINKNIEQRGTWITKKKRDIARSRIFFNQGKQGPYYICAICHQSVYQRSVRVFKPEKYHIVTADLYHPVKLFDEKFCICETYKHLHKNKLPCQAVCNNMTEDPKTVKTFKKTRKSPNLKKIVVQ